MFKPTLLIASLLTLSSWSQQLDPAEANTNQAMAQVEAEIKDPNSSLSTVGQQVQTITKSKTFSNRLEKEFSKYKVRFTIDKYGTIYSGETASVSSGAYYQYVVEPAFRNNEQVRRDIWVVSLGGAYKHISGNGQIRITFSRYFGGKNAKWDAMKAPLKGFWEAPLDSNDVKKKLAKGEAFRFEVLGDVGLGYGKDLSSGQTAASGSIRYKRAGLFIMDLYKLNEKQIRARFIGTKNRGELEIYLGGKDPLSFTSLPGILEDRLAIGFGIGFRGSFDLTAKPFTLDTMMVDYLFNFSTEDELSKEQLAQKNTGDSALEEIFHNIKRGGFSALFLFFNDHKSLSEELIKKAETAEKLAKEDIEQYNRGELEFNKVRVYNYFRGTFQSAIIAGNINAKLSALVSGESQAGSIVSHVRSFDENKKEYNYWLDNSFIRHGSRSMFGRNKYSLSHDLDVLVFSDPNMGIGQLSDVVVRTQIENTQFSDDDIDGLRKTLSNSLPGSFKNNPQLQNLLQKADHSNAYISYTHTFGENAFKAIGKIDIPRVNMDLINYFENHPERQYMHLPFDKGNPNNFKQKTRKSKYGADPTPGIGTWTQTKATEIARIFDPDSSNAETMQAFKIAKRDPVFERYLVQEFFASLLPQDKPDALFGFDLRFSSREAGTHVIQLGEHRVTRIYEAVAFMRSIINDHSLDTHMISNTDQNGNPVPVPANQQGFLAPLVSAPKN